MSAVGTSDIGERGRSYVGQEVTLDGRRAVICGRQGAFGTVAQIPAGPAYAWSWAAIAHIVEDKEGAFTS